MGSVILIVTDVIIHKTLQMALIYDDHMVEQVNGGGCLPSVLQLCFAMDSGS